MRRSDRKRDRNDHDEDEDRRETRGLAALALVLALAIAASYLVERLRAEGILEDCLLAGRINCDALLNDR